MRSLPNLAPNGHTARGLTCPLLRDERTSLKRDPRSVYDRVGPSSDNPTYLAGREHIYDSMRKAGVPEG
jgi:hypothetical protein